MVTVIITKKKGVLMINLTMISAFLLLMAFMNMEVTGQCSGPVKGKILDEQGNMSSGVIVRLIHTDFWIKTDSSGVFEISPLLAGVYELQLESEEIIPARYTITITPGRAAREIFYVKSVNDIDGARKKEKAQQYE